MFFIIFIDLVVIIIWKGASEAESMNFGENGFYSYFLRFSKNYF